MFVHRLKAKLEPVLESELVLLPLQKQKPKVQTEPGAEAVLGASSEGLCPSKSLGFCG